MRINNAGLAIVQAFEGCLDKVPGKPGYFKPYVCPAGVLTIGWGHTNHHEPKFDRTAEWSQTQCDEVLRRDMRIFETRVGKLAPEVTDPNRHAALVSWSYNTGGPADSSVWIYARKGDVAQTRIRLARWNKANGKTLAGLTRRREAEADLFEGKVDEALATAGATRLYGRMAQRVDRPTVPTSEVVKQTKGATTAAAGGVVTAGAGAGAKTTTEQPAPAPVPVPSGPSSTIAIALGIIVFIAAVVIIVRKRQTLNADWA